MPTVGLVERGESSRWYERPGTGEQLESVTHIIGACRSKPWLADWSASTAAQWAVDNHDLIGMNLTSGAGREPVIALVKEAAKRKREQARDLGSHVHHVIEALLTDAPLPDLSGLDQEYRDEIDAVVDGFLNFISDFEPELLQSEATVADPVLGLAGTLDLGMVLHRLNGKKLLVDAKSGKQLDPDMVAQLAAYLHMPETWLPTGLIVPTIRYEGAAILHLRPEHRGGYKLIVLDDEQLKTGYAWLLSIREQYRMSQLHPKLLGTVLYPALDDGSQPLPYLDDINGWGKARSALIKAGFAHLSELVGVTDTQLLTHKGVGPGCVKAVAEMLDAFGGTR